MHSAGTFVGTVSPVRRFAIGATVIEGQVVVKAASGGNGEITDPAVADQTEAVGVTLEAGTYSTTQGTGDSSASVEVLCTYSPFQLIRGVASGNTTSGTALDGTLDDAILTTTAASAGGTVITDSDVGTSEFTDGFMVGLTGGNAGAVRVIDSHSDNTSETCVVPFDNAIASGDTFLRTWRPFLQGGELTTAFDEFVHNPGAGADIPAGPGGTGHFGFFEVLVDGSAVDPYRGAVIQNSTTPQVEFVVTFIDHALNSIA